MSEISINFTNYSSGLLVVMAFTLGLRHGFDLDHLATIDSITRTVKDNVRLSKYVGLLFSFGHGFVVICMSLVIGSGIMQARSPLWLETVGQWISIVFLLAFGLLTLRNLFSYSTALPAGLKGMLFKALLGEKYNPILIMAIGALFALSFDTFTQVALLSMSVSIVSEYIFVIMLGMVFMLGMMTSDGLNGFCVSKLLQLADQKSVLISRVMGAVIACFSLVLGLLGIVKQL